MIVVLCRCITFFPPVHSDRMMAWIRPCVPLKLSSPSYKTKSRAKSRAQRTRQQRRRNKNRFPFPSLSCNVDLSKAVCTVISFMRNLIVDPVIFLLKYRFLFPAHLRLGVLSVYFLTILNNLTNSLNKNIVYSYYKYCL